MCLSPLMPSSVALTLDSIVHTNRRRQQQSNTIRSCMRPMFTNDNNRNNHKSYQTGRQTEKERDREQRKGKECLKIKCESAHSLLIDYRTKESNRSRRKHSIIPLGYRFAPLLLLSPLSPPFHTF